MGSNGIGLWRQKRDQIQVIVGVAICWGSAKKLDRPEAWVTWTERSRMNEKLWLHLTLKGTVSILQRVGFTYALLVRQCLRLVYRALLFIASASVANAIGNSLLSHSFFLARCIGSGVLFYWRPNKASVWKAILLSTHIIGLLCVDFKRCTE